MYNKTSSLTTIGRVLTGTRGSQILVNQDTSYVQVVGNFFDGGHCYSDLNRPLQQPCNTTSGLVMYGLEAMGRNQLLEGNYTWYIEIDS